MSTEVIVQLDDDDPMLGGYTDLPFNWTLSITPRKILSERYNEVFEGWSHLKWYGFLADDVVPETDGWDRTLISGAGKDGLAYGDDGIDPTRPTHFVLGGDLVRQMGWLSLPGLQRIFIDTVWHDIAKAGNVLRYVPEVKLTHHHFSNGKALMDATYRKPGKAQDAALYAKWKQETRL